MMVCCPSARLLCALTALVLTSCGKDGSIDTRVTETVSCDAPPTWHADVQPLLNQHCVSCHDFGSIAQNRPWVEYADTQPWAALIAESVEERTMPPFIAGDSEDCVHTYPLMHDARLSDDEIATLTRWAECGAPEGDPADSPGPVNVPPTPTLEDWTVEIAPDAPYSPGMGDTSMCWSLPVPDEWFPEGEDTIYLDAMEILPGDLTADHHIMVQLHDETLDASDKDGVPDGMWDCTGFGLWGGIDIGGWLPGALPVELPEGAGLPLQRNGRIGLQIHYHVVDDLPHSDLTRVRFRVGPTPLYETALYRVGNAENSSQGLLSGPNDLNDPVFYIPAGATDHSEEMLIQIPGDGSQEFAVFLVSNHMHQVGVDMRMWVEHDPSHAPPGEPQTECLLSTPRYNFDWQGFFYYDTASGLAPKVRSGDYIRIRCTYDNSLENTYWMSALESEGLPPVPFDVRVGESSLDEMCVGLIGAVNLTP